MASEWDVLRAWSAEVAGLTLQTDHIDRLRAYIDLLRFWNRRIGLVARGDVDRLVLRHVADSIFAASRCIDGEDVVDLGSGAGFPGLPVAILRRASRVCLVESQARKVSFLTEAIRVTSVANAHASQQRMESAARTDPHRGRYMIAISRALADTTDLAKSARELLSPGGRMITMKARSQAVDSSEGHVIDYRLPDGAERLLLIRPR